MMEKSQLKAVSEPVSGEVYSVDGDHRVAIACMKLDSEKTVAWYEILRHYTKNVNKLPLVIMFLGWVELPLQSFYGEYLPKRLAECLVGDKIVFLATTRGRGWVPLEFVPLDKDQSSI